MSGKYEESITNPELLEALRIGHLERLRHTPNHRKTHRFLKVEGSGYAEAWFRFTTDKSDLSEREQRMLELGDEVVLAEEAAQAAIAQQEAEERRIAYEAALAKHTPLIEKLARAVVHKSGRSNADLKQAISVEDVSTLLEAGLLQSSTIFRQSHYHGEVYTIQYKFTEGASEYIGFLGFDVDLRLKVVDERSPAMIENYLG